jgi:hypothetical protein
MYNDYKGMMVQIHWLIDRIIKSTRDRREEDDSDLLAALLQHAGGTSCESRWLPLSLLDEMVLREAPFENEEEYWQLVTACITLRCWKSTLVSSWLKTAVVLPNTAAASGGELIRHVEGVTAGLRLLLKTRSNLTNLGYPAPRMIRLARRINMTDFETDVVHLLVVGTTTAGLPGSGVQVNVARDILIYLEPSASDFMRLFERDCSLVRDGILMVELQGYMNVLGKDVGISFPIMKVLRGADLNTEDLHALGDGPLLEVLHEEPHFASNRSGSGGAQMTSAHPTLLSDSTQVEAAPHLEIQTTAEPYATDLEYIMDNIGWLSGRIRLKTMLLKGEEGSGFDKSRGYAVNVRELRIREQIDLSRIRSRLRASQEARNWQPRIEIVAQRLGLDDFEKRVLLLLTGMSASLEMRQITDNGRTNVGETLFLFSEGIETEVLARRSFSRQAPLVRESLVTLNQPMVDFDILRAQVTIDKRLTDYFLGLEGEPADAIDGSHLYRPTVDLDRVVLPVEEKELVVRTVLNFPAFQRERRRCGLDELVSYGGGLVLLFHGPPGTGKTMMANALATRMGKQMLLFNFAHLQPNSGGEALRLFFREARIYEAVILFDECDALFESRERFNAEIATLLTALERYDGLVILATNRPSVIDEAVQRRITLMVDFTMPGENERAQIWDVHLPKAPGATVDYLWGEIDVPGLAHRYPLSGGLIKNAVLAALAMAVGRAPENPRVTQQDLEIAAGRQVRKPFYELIDTPRREVALGFGSDSLSLRPAGMKNSLKNPV